MLKCVLRSCCPKWQHAWKPTKLNISGLIEGPEYSNSWWKAVRLEHVYKCQCQCQWYLVDRINSSLLSSISDSWWQRFRLCQPEQPEQSSIKNQSMPMPCACGTTTILSWLQYIALTSTRIYRRQWRTSAAICKNGTKIELSICSIA